MTFLYLAFGYQSRQISGIAFCVSLKIIQKLIAFTKTYLSLACHQAISSFAIQLFKRTETTCEIVFFFACAQLWIPAKKAHLSAIRLQKAAHRFKTFPTLGGFIYIQYAVDRRNFVDLNLYKICAHLQVPRLPMLIQSSPLNCVEKLHAPCVESLLRPFFW